MTEPPKVGIGLFAGLMLFIIAVNTCGTQRKLSEINNKLFYIERAVEKVPSD